MPEGDLTPIKMSRFFEHPRGVWTFQMPKLRTWTEERLEGETVLNLFGGLTRLTPNQPSQKIWHNDIMIDYLKDGELNRDAYDLSKWQDFQASVDTVVFDPPYSAFQAVVSYGVKKAQKVTHARDVVEYVLKPTGRVISYGFNSTGMSAKRSFIKEEILLVNCGASHNDYICTVERRKPIE